MSREIPHAKGGNVLDGLVDTMCTKDKWRVLGQEKMMYMSHNSIAEGKATLTECAISL